MYVDLPTPAPPMTYTISGRSTLFCLAESWPKKGRSERRLGLGNLGLCSGGVPDGDESAESESTTRVFRPPFLGLTGGGLARLANAHMCLRRAAAPKETASFVARRGVCLLCLYPVSDFIRFGDFWLVKTPDSAGQDSPKGARHCEVGSRNLPTHPHMNP